MVATPNIYSLVDLNGGELRNAFEKSVNHETDNVFFKRCMSIDIFNCPATMARLYFSDILDGSSNTCITNSQLTMGEKNAFISGTIWTDIGHYISTRKRQYQMPELKSLMSAFDQSLLSFHFPTRVSVYDQDGTDIGEAFNEANTMLESRLVMDQKNGSGFITDKLNWSNNKEERRESEKFNNWFKGHLLK